MSNFIVVYEIVSDQEECQENGVYKDYITVSAEKDSLSTQEILNAVAEISMLEDTPLASVQVVAIYALRSCRN